MKDCRRGRFISYGRAERRSGIVQVSVVFHRELLEEEGSLCLGTVAGIHHQDGPALAYTNAIVTVKDRYLPVVAHNFLRFCLPMLDEIQADG